MEIISEALAMEVRHFGIKVCIVEPGDTKTGFTDNRQFAAASRGSVYEKYFNKAINTMIKDEQDGPEPLVVAKVVASVLRRKNPPVRTAVGFNYKVLLFLRRILPYKAAQYIISQLY
jgi:short-subunit dehydrogenase